MSTKPGLPDDYFSDVVGAGDMPKADGKSPAAKKRAKERLRDSKAVEPPRRSAADGDKADDKESAEVEKTMAKPLKGFQSAEDALVGEDDAYEGVILDDEDAGSVEGVMSIISDLEAQLQSAYEMRTALERDLAEVSGEAADLGETNTEQKRRIRFLEAKIPDLEMLKEELEFAEHEKSQAQRTIARLSKTVEAKDEEAVRQTASLEEKQNLLRELKASNAKLEYELVDLEERSARLDALEAEHKDLKEENDRLTTRVDALETELARAKDDLEDLESEQATARNTIAELRRECAEQEEQNETIETANRELRARVAVLEDESRELNEKLPALEKQLKTAAEEKKRLDAELGAARKTMRGIHTALAGTKARVADRIRSAR